MMQTGSNSRIPGQRRLINIAGGYLAPLLLVALFAYSGAAKLVDHDLFIYQLKINRLTRAGVTAISYALPVAELLVAALLCYKTTRILALWLTSFFMLVFVVYMALVLSARQIPCSCGGVIAAMSWTGHLYFNSIFFLLSVVTLYYHKSLRTYKGVS